MSIFPLQSSGVDLVEAALTLKDEATDVAQSTSRGLVPTLRPEFWKPNPVRRRIHLK